LPDFQELFDRACERKGGPAAVETLLEKPRSARSLARLPDDRYLAEFSKKIFQSGFVWRVVEQKWPNFEEMFWGFDVDKLLMMPDEMLDRKASDKRIIRNHRKVFAIRENALMIADTRREQGVAFSKFVSKWPQTDMVGLWLYLKQRGCRLGGNTGPYALRSLGVDTFLLSRDVEGFLRAHGIVDSGIGSKRALLSAQEFFNQLREESGRSLTELSQLVSFSVGKNWVGIDHDGEA
jgi:3-methyladenine DNA glycosylase Tag